MNEIKSIMILGLGAVGTVVASKLADAGYEVDILCDRKRAERYKKNNFIINEKKYRFNYITKEECTIKPDLVIIATKHYSLREAIVGLENIVGEDTIVMSLLNGIDSEEIISEVIGEESIVYSFIYQTDATKVKNTTKFASSGIIALGERAGEKSGSIMKIAELFDSADIKYDIKDDILKAMWWKYMVNIGLNQVSAVLRAPYGVFLRNDEIWSLAKRAMLEAKDVAKRKEIFIDEDSDAQVYTMLKNLHPEGKTSMFQDVEAKRKTEVEMLSGQLCRMGEDEGIETPVNKVLYEQLKAVESMY